MASSAASPPSPMASAQIKSLDGFRAIAILIVMASHAELEWLLPGQFGVTLFFFLSGYLITTLLRREMDETGDLDLPGFYLRRLVRIFPPMYLTILFAAALSGWGLIPPMNLAGLPYDFAFLTNYFPKSNIPIGLWSLAVEEHFYLLFPGFLLIVGSRLRAGQTAVLCLLLCGLFLGIRLLEVARLDNFSDVNFWTHTRLDSILFGSILALWNNPVIDKGTRLPTGKMGLALALGLLALTFLIRDEAFRQTLRYTVQGFGLLLLFNVAIRAEGPVAALLDSPPARFVAALSYTLYLVHVVTIKLAAPLADTVGKPIAIALGIALAFLYAMAMRRWVEQPLMRWRRGVERAARAKKLAAEKGKAEVTPKPMTVDESERGDLRKSIVMRKPKG